MTYKRRAWASRVGALAVLGMTLCAGPASADEPAAIQTLPARPKPFAYGILVGSNRGGPGQNPLHYAGDDAKKMAAVLGELGRYGPGDMRVLLEPSASEVMSALDVIGQRLREHERKKEQAIVVFYYSGHAKANAVHLGGEQIEITALRDRLRTLPSTLTLVVLDACQSGTLHRTKGAAPAADFSYNSVARLTTQGIAVMASSNAQELSQESDELKGSYFTHHLVVALRGAGDLDHDGKVTLEEAYRYAYRRTLAATERTAVGAQHVTLETDLSGQGEVPLTFPAEAKSQLELPASLEGRVVIQQKSTSAIVAEIHKVGGAPIRVALASGDYDALVRVGSSVRSCPTTLIDHQIAQLDLGLGLGLGRCSVVSANELTRAKGEGDESPPQDRDKPLDPTLEGPRERTERSRWVFELGVGGAHSENDAYAKRLSDFEYSRDRSTALQAVGLIARTFAEDHLAFGVEGHNLASAEFSRQNDRVELGGFGIAAVARAALPFDFARSGHFELYGQGRFGLASATESITTSAKSSDETHFGYLVGGDFGLAIYGRFIGGFISGGYDYAPIIKNALSDQHNMGGTHVLAGLRFQAH